MDLGQYRFNPQQNCLIHQESGEVKPLTRSELQVLTQLLDNPGVTLSKHQLSCGDHKSPQISESAVVKAVFTLRHTLEEPFASCLHTVPKEGYQFVPLGDSPHVSTHTNAKRLSPKFVSVMQVLSIAALLLVSIPLLYQTLNHRYQAPPLSTSVQEAKNDYGQLIEVEIVTSSPSNIRTMKQYSDFLIQHFAGCVYSPWDKVKLALSHDQQMLNVTMFSSGESQDIRNMKISDFRATPEFINPGWLKQVSICE